tara:strand:- start:335 stop:721 length:387 start_codon:yes stop_codon:yes gene_type:complete
VFSEIDNDVVNPTYVQCNNCGAVHKVYDLCKSEIIVGRDELRTMTTIDEVKLGMSSDIVGLLEAYDCDLPTWQHVKFSIVNNLAGEKIILTRDIIEEETQGKVLTVKEDGTFLLENYINREYIDEVAR